MPNPRQPMSDDERYLAQEAHRSNRKFAMRLAFGSVLATVAGVFLLLDGFVLKILEPHIGNLWWKGALLIGVGILGVFMGRRMYKSANASERENLA